MKREILFRGKRVDNGGWVYGFYLANINPHKEYNSFDNHFIYEGVNIKDAIEVHPSTVGQFTGLHDKDGNKIFEGDVLLIGSNELGFMVNGKGHPARYIVKHEGCDYVLFRPDTNLVWGRLSRIEELCWGCEIIDNIHDNPELNP